VSRILVVEDVPITRRVIELALLRMQHEVLGTCSPLAAPQLVREHAPDLLVLDYFMPYLDGIALLSQLRGELGERCPRALFVTAAPYELVMANAERCGALGCVTKPFRLRDLERAVVSALSAERVS